MHFDSSVIELMILFGNIAVAIMNSSIRSKMREIKMDIQNSANEQKNALSEFRAVIYKEFLTKDDYYTTIKRKD